MNVLTVPRTVAAYEYKALRFPAQLLETRLIAAKFPEESTVRLAFERLLGTLDSTAGALFADEALKTRGRALSRRAEIVEKAVELEAKAQQRKQEADATLHAEREQAAADKRRVQQEHDRKAKQIKAEREAAQAAVSQKAKAREKAEDTAIAAKTEATVAAERDRLDAQAASIEARVDVPTAAPKAQLDKAVKDTAAAQKTKGDADRLAQLADAEKQARQDG